MVIILVSCINPSYSDNRIGLWSSEVTEDGCGIHEIVDDFFSSGEINNVPDPYASLYDKIFGYMGYNTNEYGFYKVRHRNIYESILAYVIESLEYRHIENCSSNILITTSIGPSWKDSKDYLRSGQYDLEFYSVNNILLCVQKNYGEIANWPEPAPLIRSCTDTNNLDNSFDVQYVF